MEDGEIRKGYSNIQYNLYEECEKDHVFLDEKEVITKIKGYASDSIRYLKFCTNFDREFEFGDYSKKKNQNFCIEIPNNRVVFSMFGGLDFERNSNLLLIFFNFIIVYFFYYSLK